MTKLTSTMFALVISFIAMNALAFDPLSMYDVWCNPLEDQCNVTFKRTGKEKSYTREKLYGVLPLARPSTAIYCEDTVCFFNNDDTFAGLNPDNR